LNPYECYTAGRIINTNKSLTSNSFSEKQSPSQKS